MRTINSLSLAEWVYNTSDRDALSRLKDMAHGVLKGINKTELYAQVGFLPDK